MPAESFGNGEGQPEFLPEEALAARLKEIQHAERFTYRGPDITIEFAHGLIARINRKSPETMDRELRAINLSREAYMKIYRLSDDIAHRMDAESTFREGGPVPIVNHTRTPSKAPRKKRAKAAATSPVQIPADPAPPAAAESLAQEPAIVPVEDDPAPRGNEPDARTAQEIVHPDPAWLEGMTALAKMMSDETRVKILLTLSSMTNGERINVTTMARRFGVSQSSLSHHISLLELSGFLSLDQDGGRQNFYSVTEKFRGDMKTIMRFLAGKNGDVGGGDSDR